MANVNSRLPMAEESWTADGIGNIAADVAEFGQRDVFQPFTASIETFVDFNRGFPHKTVRSIASAPEEKFSPRVTRVCPSLLSKARPSKAADFFGSRDALTAGFSGNRRGIRPFYD